MTVYCAVGNNHAKQWIDKVSAKLSEEKGEAYRPLSEFNLRPSRFTSLKKQKDFYELIFHKNIWFAPVRRKEDLIRDYGQCAK